MHHLARRQVFRRQEHDHAVHAPEAPGRHTLVVHTVLATDHRQGVPRHPLEFTQRSLGLVALHAEQHHVPGLAAGLRWAAHGGNPQTHVLRRGDEAQPLALQGAQVGTTSDEQHIHAVLEEPRTNGTANAARPVDDESHPLGPHPLQRRGKCAGCPRQKGRLPSAANAKPHDGKRQLGLGGQPAPQTYNTPATPIRLGEREGPAPRKKRAEREGPAPRKKKAN